MKQIIVIQERNVMNRSLSEQKVLKKLGITDFRHLTKEKVISMAGLLDKMDPEVAKKAIEQFPNFSSTMKEILIEYRDSLNKAMDSNSESVQSFYDTCKSIIATCQKELDKDNLSFEERKSIIEQMLIVARMQDEKDSENKRFLGSIVLASLSAIAITAAALLTALGGKTTTSINDDDNDDSDDDTNTLGDTY